MKTVLGIDPGSSGAAVLITEAKDYYVALFKNKTIDDISGWISVWDLKLLIKGYLEKVGAMSKDSVHNAFTFGSNTGKLKGVFSAYSIPYEEISPQTWQRHFGLGAKFPTKAKRKNAHKQKAQELFPDLKVTLDMADALLIAQYGWDKTFK